jgi:ATP-binding cassette subfamily F protein uup
MQQSRLKSLSGGEKKRLYLLSALMFGANFIILDEPTNDLDIKTLEILEDYLDAFSGCILTVSHDRFFLDRVVDFIFVFSPDGITKFPGNYSDYLLVKRFQAAEEEENKSFIIQNEKTVLKAQKPKKLGYMQQRELLHLEEKIALLEDELATLERLLLENAAELKPADFTRITISQDKLKKELTLLEERWLELSSIED